MDERRRTTEDRSQKTDARFSILGSRYAQDSDWGLEVVSKNSLYVKRVRALRMTIMNFQKAEFKTRTLPFDPSALLLSSLIRLPCHFFAKATKEPASVFAVQLRRRLRRNQLRRTRRRTSDSRCQIPTGPSCPRFCFRRVCV